MCGIFVTTTGARASSRARRRETATRDANEREPARRA